MNSGSATLDRIKLGNKARIRKVDTEEDIKRRLLDIGLVEGTIVEAILESPGKDPIAYFIRGALIAIRKDDAKKIIVDLL